MILKLNLNLIILSGLRPLALALLPLIFVVQAYTQEQTNTWSINLLLARYDGIKSDVNDPGDVLYNINPGMEVLYGHKLSEIYFLHSGISYQYVRLESTAYKFRVGELSIPVLLSMSAKPGLSVATGIYAGKFLHFAWDRSSHNEWIPVNPKDQEHYSDKNFFMDAYLGLSYSGKKWSRNGNAFRMEPFIRYRFKENWMDHYRTSIYYGIKLGVDLNFLENDTPD